MLYSIRITLKSHGINALSALEENMKYQKEYNIMKNWDEKEEGNGKRKSDSFFDRRKKKFESASLHSNR